MVPLKEDLPDLPVTPEEIVADVRRCFELGVSMVHVHARNALGYPTWDPQIYSEIISGIRDVDSDIIIIASTSGRNWPEIEQRSAVLQLGLKVMPDMGSLTLGSLNFPTGPSNNSAATIAALAKIMMTRGIVPELEVFEVGMIDYSRYLISKDILKPPFYYNLIFGSRGCASLSARNISAFIDALPTGATWAMAGIGRFQLNANIIALALGGHLRLGLEDNPYLDWNDRKSASNPRLVERAIRIAREMGRLPVSPAKARQMIGLSKHH